MKYEIDWEKIPLADQIQMLYPSEPGWSEVDSETRLVLIETFDAEPNGATLALGELDRRRHVRTEELAHWLLTQESADEWLKKAAHDTLESINGRPSNRDS